MSLAKTCSIGFRSGEYFGRKKSLAPTERMSWRTAFALVAAEVVQDDIAGSEDGQKNPLDIGAKTHAIDQPLDEPWRIDPVMVQGRQEGHRLPAAVRDLGGKPVPARHPRKGAMSVLV